MNDGIKQIFNGSLFKKQSVLSDYDLNALKAYNAEIERGVSPMTAYYRTLQDASETAINMAEAAGKSTVNLAKIPKVTKASQIAIQGLVVAGNMIATLGISLVVSKAIEYFSELANTVNNTREAAEGFSNSISRYNSNLSKNKSLLNDLNSRYKELSKGVGTFGQNLTLSTSEYEEYKNIISQVSDIMAKKSRWLC